MTQPSSEPAESKIFASESDYRAAIDATLQLAEHEVRIFDADLNRMVFSDAGRVALLAAFITGHASRRLKIVLHDVELLTLRLPRLVALIGRHVHQIEIRKTPDHLHHLADPVVLADEIHGVHRFHFDHPRGKKMAGIIEVHPLWQRFDELWGASEHFTPTSPAGL